MCPTLPPMLRNGCLVLGWIHYSILGVEICISKSEVRFAAVIPHYIMELVRATGEIKAHDACVLM